MTIEIMNLKYTRPSEPYDFRCDRKTPVGNPFPITKDRDRVTSIRLFGHFFQIKMATNRQFREHLFNMRRIYNHYGKLRLFCWCAPEHCHTEIIKDWILKP